jgi:hypothetical protein
MCLNLLCVAAPCLCLCIGWYDALLVSARKRASTIALLVCMGVQERLLYAALRIAQEATDEFDAIHSAKAKGMLKQYLIGRLGDAPPEEPGLPVPQEPASVRSSPPS